MPSKAASTSPGGPVSNRLRSFFRMNSSASSINEKERGSNSLSISGVPTGNGNSSDSHSTKTSRHTKLFNSTVGRLRSHTVASENNKLEEAMSPTALANPYFAHQGQPGLRHHNEGSVPPSPPDTPTLKISSPDGTEADQATSETKEELARRLRRVASAPNAQGLFANAGNKGDRPGTAELGKDPLIQNAKSGSLSLIDGAIPEAQHPLHAEDTLGALPPPQTPLAFRRTYSSNSIKVRDVEVGPSSFDKIKLIGKGDVGKVYLVREKKSNRLYAMKGNANPKHVSTSVANSFHSIHSLEQKGDDQEKQDQARPCRTRNSRDEQPSLHCHSIPLVPV